MWSPKVLIRSFFLLVFYSGVHAQTAYVSAREQRIIDAGTYGFIFALILSIVAAIVLSKSTAISLDKVKTIGSSIFGGLMFATLVHFMHGPSPIVDVTDFGRAHMFFMATGSLLGAVVVTFLVSKLFPNE